MAALLQFNNGVRGSRRVYEITALHEDIPKCMTAGYLPRVIIALCHPSQVRILPCAERRIAGGMENDQSGYMPDIAFRRKQSAYPVCLAQTVRNRPCPVQDTVIA